MAVNIAYTNTVGPTQAPDAPQFAQGKITYPATAITAADYTVVSVGFTPRHVVWDNTTGIKVEWFEGMAADTCIKYTAGGVRTIETTNKGISICDADGTANATGSCFMVSQNATLIAITADDVVYWQATN